MVEARKNGHRLFFRKVHSINLNGTNAVSIRKLVEVLLAHTDVVHLEVGYQFLEKKGAIDHLLFVAISVTVTMHSSLPQ